jgi:hypothetical protein
MHLIDLFEATHNEGLPKTHLVVAVSVLVKQ